MSSFVYFEYVFKFLSLHNTALHRNCALPFMKEGTKKYATAIQIVGIIGAGTGRESFAKPLRNLRGW